MLADHVFPCTFKTKEIPVRHIVTSQAILFFSVYSEKKIFLLMFKFKTSIVFLYCQFKYYRILGHLQNPMQWQLFFTYMPPCQNQIFIEWHGWLWQLLYFRKFDSVSYEMTRMQPCHISDIYLKGKQNSRGVRIIFKISL